MASGRYTAISFGTISTAITMMEITAPSTACLEIYRAWVANTANAGFLSAKVQINRKTVSVTGAATPPTPAPLEVGMPASGVTVKHNATAEGTDGDILFIDSFNMASWVYLPIPEERIWVPPSGILAIKFAGAPAIGIWSYGFTWREIG